MVGRAIVLWIAFTAVLLVALEAGTRWGFRRVSRIESRTAAEFKEACAIRPVAGESRPSVLLLGNSLLLEGVDMDRLRKLLASRARITRFVIESTDYLDWYYGVRRLLAEGSRPDVIVVCLNTQQLTSHHIRGDYSSYYLFRATDIGAVARDAHYDLTEASGLLLARFSLFYAGRQNLRPYLLERIDPPYGDLLHDLQTTPGVLPPASELERSAEARLRRMKSAAEKKGGHFVFLLPPGFTAGEREIVDAGARQGVQVLVPIHLRALPESDFRDGFHLNAVGARIFTDALAAELGRVAAASHQ